MNATPMDARMLFDMPKGKYHMVALALEWLSVIQRLDENKGMNQSELVKNAIDDILSGRVTEEEVHKRAAEKPQQNEEKKSAAPHEPYADKK